ncbi:SAM-dependent methyltransferase [Actinoplanes sp. NPDC051470]|uniref:SAM-dependent methyltransferase n=1 Tax=Actinoplanes sp. NPDC051470 TaxID=3157224 RepID=UPI00342604CE
MTPHGTHPRTDRTAAIPASEPPDLADGIDTSIAHPARRYNYWLGGKDNFAADRASGDAIARKFPGIRKAAIENRKLMCRVVDWAARQGITQFVDIGTGIPVSPNTHETAQAIQPAARVVYVDNDPLVLAHARALLTSTTQRGRTEYMQADLRDAQAILDHDAVRDTIDFTQPVAVLLFAVLHFLPDEAQVRHILHTLTAPLAADSILAASHATYDFMPAPTRRQLETELAGEAGQHGTFQPRTGEQFLDLFASNGLEPVEPGLVSAIRWHPQLQPHPGESVTDADASSYAYVGRRP